MQNLDCIFCDLYATQKEDILIETNLTFSFHDIKKGSAKEHLLVCSKECIKNVNYLTPSHLLLLKEMKEVAEKLVEKLAPGSTYRLGFHRPPFYSVKHLHLHVLVEPIDQWFMRTVTYGLNLRSLDSVVSSLEKL